MAAPVLHHLWPSPTQSMTGERHRNSTRRAKRRGKSTRCSHGLKTRKRTNRFTLKRKKRKQADLQRQTLRQTSNTKRTNRANTVGRKHDKVKVAKHMKLATTQRCNRTNVFNRRRDLLANTFARKHENATTKTHANTKTRIVIAMSKRAPLTFKVDKVTPATGREANEFARKHENTQTGKGTNKDGQGRAAVHRRPCVAGSGQAVQAPGGPAGQDDPGHADRGHQRPVRQIRA